MLFLFFSDFPVHLKHIYLELSLLAKAWAGKSVISAIFFLSIILVCYEIWSKSLKHLLFNIYLYTEWGEKHSNNINCLLANFSKEMKPPEFVASGPAELLGTSQVTRAVIFRACLCHLFGATEKIVSEHTKPAHAYFTSG